MSNTNTAISFDSTWESLQTYRCPEWFRDAKFGIWAHWGPQAVPRCGDWYARQMYQQGHPQYEHHLRHYGHPSERGYKDIITEWKAENFDPDHLIGLYKKAGAKYFTACASHHDNFDCWDSKYHKYNSVNIGPKKDIVGLWAEAARKHGLRFGVTEHLERAYSWFNTNKGADKTGPKAGIPYDGNDPEWQDFYFPPHDDTNFQYPLNPPDWWVRQWSDRIKDLIDRYDPDLLYTDGGIPFGELGRDVIAHFYNKNLSRHDNKLEAVYALKDSKYYGEEHMPVGYGGHGDYREGVGVLDMERGGVASIHPNPWQTDTCVGEWFYHDMHPYKSPKLIIHLLADIVSKNGNLLLNFPPRPDGTLDFQELGILEAIGAWFTVNGEAIYDTRPWHTFGEGPGFQEGNMTEPDESPLDADTIRYTTKGDTLYAIALGWPEGGAWHLSSLESEHLAQIELLGCNDGPLTFTRDGGLLQVTAPRERPACDLAYVLKITRN